MGNSYYFSKLEEEGDFRVIQGHPNMKVSLALISLESC